MTLEGGRLTPSEITADALITRAVLIDAVWAMSQDGHLSLPAVDRYFKQALGEMSLARLVALSIDSDLPFQRIAESADRLNRPDQTLFPNSGLGGQS